MRPRILVIGGGLVGLATSRALARTHPLAEIVLLEKEEDLAMHQSGNNSGVLHAGLDYKPGSAKARLSVLGINRMVTFCQEHGVPYDLCGKLVVATDASELPRLRQLLERGRANGLSGLRMLSQEEAAEVEPHVACVAAVHVPEEGIVDFSTVAATLARDLGRLGVEIHTDSPFLSAHREGRRWRVVSSTNEFTADLVINCAGLFADRVATAMGERDVPKIVPFRGDYSRLVPSREHLARHLVYPVPNPVFPFLGVHFTRRVGGGVECGPSAVLAMKREGYRKTDISLQDTAEVLSYPGVWRFVGRHFRTVAFELWQAASSSAFARALQRLVPEVGPGDLEPGGAGVRAQVMMRDGTLVKDFLFLQSQGAFHVLNAPSPAATASLQIGEHIAERALSTVPEACSD